ncbi:NUDIX hydrolase [Anaerococcus sp. mt242]|uniref:NUDIX hydrolase n=1 Tax=Anaerococcus sp. mt242 TaxID=2661917 RepID=UPI001931F5B8|nr:NUDIX hydrolase [Anaerococcus sp. mt242]MBM0046370.1 NUDIX hydrolase [Anaerococcus sp. mt242]
MSENKFYETSIKSDTIYDGKILKLRVETVELQNKKYSKREIVDHQKGVGIIAYDGDDKLWMVSQYRIVVDKVMLEIPAGLVDPNEAPIESAKRELQEEVGFFPEQIDFLFTMHASPGFTNDKLLFFVAKNLKESKLELDEDENLEAKSYPIDELYNMVENGEITDAKTIIAIQYAIMNKNN